MTVPGWRERWRQIFHRQPPEQPPEDDDRGPLFGADDDSEEGHDMTADPFEPPGGQDDDPPDLRLAIRATLLLLTEDLRPRLAAEKDTDPEAAEFLLRLIALVRVWRRIRDGLDAEGGGAP
jgi:hypothetical protein